MTEEKQKKIDSIEMSIQCASYILYLLEKEPISINNNEAVNKAFNWMKHISDGMQKDLDAEKSSGPKA